MAGSIFLGQDYWKNKGIACVARDPQGLWVWLSHLSWGAYCSTS